MMMDFESPSKNTVHSGEHYPTAFRAGFFDRRGASMKGENMTVRFCNALIRSIRLEEKASHTLVCLQHFGSFGIHCYQTFRVLGR